MKGYKIMFYDIVNFVFDKPFSTIYYFFIISIVVTLILFFYSKKKNKNSLCNICRWLLVVENMLPLISIIIYIINDAINYSHIGVSIFSGWNDKAYGYDAFIITIFGYLVQIGFILIIHIAILICIIVNIIKYKSKK